MPTLHDATEISAAGYGTGRHAQLTAAAKAISIIPVMGLRRVAGAQSWCSAIVGEVGSWVEDHFPKITQKVHAYASNARYPFGSVEAWLARPEAAPLPRTPWHHTRCPAPAISSGRSHPADLPQGVCIWRLGPPVNSNPMCVSPPVVGLYSGQLRRLLQRMLWDIFPDRGGTFFSLSASQINLSSRRYRLNRCLRGVAGRKHRAADRACGKPVVGNKKPPAANRGG